jgi:hypothetical protein
VQEKPRPPLFFSHPLHLEHYPKFINLFRLPDLL